MTAPTATKPAACRVCGCTEAEPCPMGRESGVSCLPVPDPKGSPRLCHWCAGQEAGAVRCEVRMVGLFVAGPEPEQCGAGATHTAHWRCARGHDRRLNVCRMHSRPAPDSSISDECAECPDADRVPVHLRASALLYPPAPAGS